MSGASVPQCRPRRGWRLALAAAAALCCSAGARADRPADAPQLHVGAPAGFDQLLKPQEAMVDVFVGGRAVGQTRLRYGSGRVTLLEVDALLALVPDLIDIATARAALAAPELDAHPGLVCPADADPASCRTLTPADAGVILDAARFRIDLFFNPRLLALHPASERRYLPPPEARLSLVDQIGGTVAGSDGYVDYTVLNRAILGYGHARVRSEMSYSSRYGLLADTLAAELDTPGYRYAAGVQWTPGIDLTGRRRILGVGVQSQIDTRLDRTLIAGSPLVVSLAARARVDVLRDGRLLTSRTYDAGNQALDTSSLPDGAYELVLHVTEAGGAVRDERRFFTKNAAIAAIGDPIVFAYAGLLANDRVGTFIATSRTPFYEAGIARRLTPQLALDATVLGTDRNALIELGGYWLGHAAQWRAAGLASLHGQFGVLAQATSSGTARLNYAVDLRRVWSPGGRPLIPLGDSVATAMILRADPAARVSTGGFTQVNGTINYALPRGQFALSGFYRRDQRARASYGLGPSLTIPLIQRGGLQVTVRGDATITNQGRAAFLGISLQRLRGTAAWSASAGLRASDVGGTQRGVAAVGGIAGAWQRDRVLGGELALSGGVEREVGGTLARGHADLRTRAAALYADVAQPLAGSNGATQYSFGFQTTAAATHRALVLQGRERNDAIIVVSVQEDGEPRRKGAAGAPFEVLVDNGTRGTVRLGETLAVSVPAYRQYAVRLRSTGEELMHLDGGTRKVSVYPGTVARLEWKTRHVVAMFGRLLWHDGTPVANAAIHAAGAIGDTDAAGYFQIETIRNAVLKIQAPDGRSCQLPVHAAATPDGYAALGTLACVGASFVNQIADLRP
ncbi:TcfC E-set like domain-containing protein [Sphingomonas sp. 2SG]|uniref:TcfC E-set like domain-containing protein n=1 Tax=Sphingomonas sp. 2SG TaxID=2502201 RepID=UPI0010F7E91A|nr:TcfC E-set like domain-containing protein [Sphingomonas sp. 2SG]